MQARAVLQNRATKRQQLKQLGNRMARARTGSLLVQDTHVWVSAGETPAIQRIPECTLLPNPFLRFFMNLLF